MGLSVFVLFLSPPPSMIWLRRYRRYLAFFPISGVWIFEFYWYVLAIRRVYRFSVWRKIFGHLTFCSSRLCFSRSGPCRDIRRLDFCIFVGLDPPAGLSRGKCCPFFPDDLCTSNRGMGERNFFSLIYELYRQEGEKLCLFLRALVGFLCRFSVALRNALCEKFSGANFGFQALVSGHCFFRVVLLRFS